MGILNHFDKEATAEETVLATKADPELDARVNHIMSTYQEWRSNRPRGFNYSFYMARDRVLSLNLRKKEVHEFAQRLAQQQREDHFHYAGLFLSGVIQASYISGENNFVISTKPYKTHFHFIGAFLAGTQESPLHITLHGDPHSNFCFDSEYLHVKLYGEIHGGMHVARHSTFEIYGHADDRSAMHATGCIFRSPYDDTLRFLHEGYQIDRAALMEKKEFSDECLFYKIESDGSHTLLYNGNTRQILK